MRVPVKYFSPLLTTTYSLWLRSLSFSIHNIEDYHAVKQTASNVAIAVWHNEFFPLLHLRKMNPEGFITIASMSNDGELITGVLKRLHLEVARGSSSRRGEKALIQAIKGLSQTKKDIVVTVDGPRGPRHKPKSGVFFFADKLGIPILPIRIFTPRAKVFRSWDRFRLPYPFSKCTICIGEPYFLTYDIHTPEGLKLAKNELESKLKSLQP